LSPSLLAITEKSGLSRVKAAAVGLTRGFYQKLGKPPSAQPLQDALAVLEAKAQFDSPESHVYTRVAPHGDGIYLDLCNERWEAVEITD
jgi:hypothetical protein